MQPTHAEVARTLAAGHLPAGAHIARRQGPFPVRHVADGHGRLLLLSPADGVLAAALRPADGNDDSALVLDIADVPPLAGAPSRSAMRTSALASSAAFVSDADFGLNAMLSPYLLGAPAQPRAGGLSVTRPARRRSRRGKP